jgi:hypothetical protein
MRLPRSHDTKLNGPVPTGFSLKASPNSSTADGNTIAVVLCVRCAMNGANCALSVKVSV